MKTRSTKKALLASLLSLVVCVSLLVGSTFAWFTDSVTSAQNVIQSGNLDVELYYADKVTTDDNGNDTTAWKPVTSSTDIYGHNLWEPGFTKVAYFKVVNEGSLALKYSLSADVYDEKAGKNQAGESFLLSNYIKTSLVDVGVTRDEVLALAGTPLKNSFAMSGEEHLTAKGTAGASKVVGMAIWMPTTVGNDANHNGTDVPSITFGINLFATQDTVEADSFNNQYDKDAEFSVDVKNADELANALKVGGKVKLVGDIQLSNSVEVPAGVAVELDLNGKTITGTKGRDADNNRIHVIVNNGTLTIAGGTVASTGTNGGSAVLNKGVLTLEDVTIEGAPSDTTNGDYASYAVNTDGAGSQLTVNNANISGRGAIGVTNGAKVVVNGGTYKSPVPAWGHCIYAVDAGTEVTINGGTFSEGFDSAPNDWTYMIYSGKSAKVTVNGGTFSAWDSAATVDYYAADTSTIEFKGGTFSSDPTAYVAPGHQVTNNGDGTWTVEREYITVTPAGNDKVANGNALADVINNTTESSYIALGAGEYKMPSISGGKEVTLVGTEGTVIDMTNAANVSGSAVTFENLKIVGVNSNTMNGYGIQGTTGDIVYKNCTFENAYTSEYYGNVSYIDCTFTGTFYIATYAVKSATFENCVFDRTDSRALLVYSHGDNPVKVTVKDCDFKAAAKGYTWVPEWTAAVEVDTTNIPSAGTTVTIENCTYDENYNGIVRDKSTSGKETAVITVDGVVVDNTTIKTIGYAG